MIFKRIGKRLLFPPVGVMLVLLPVAAVFLVYSMLCLGTESPLAYVSYALASYTLTVWCARIPLLIEFFGKFKRENKFAVRWFTDRHLRVNVSLYGSLLWNTAYAVLQLGLGFWHGSFWFFSLAGYYLCLAVMRFFLVGYTKRFKPGERVRSELVRYRACGIAFLIMNIALTVIILFMVYLNRTFRHHEITAIAMAAYTFVSLSAAIVNIIKYRKIGSPVYSASKAISLAAACVSMLTLESTMLTAFGSDKVTPAFRSIMLGVSGSAVSAFIIGMAVYMIFKSNKQLKLIKEKTAPEIPRLSD